MSDPTDRDDPYAQQAAGLEKSAAEMMMKVNRALAKQPSSFQLVSFAKQDYRA